MPLFVAQHRHIPAECPASPGNGSVLLSRISAVNAARHGVTIEAEALIDGEHRLVLVLEAADRQAVQDFLSFLLESGDLQIVAASAAEQAVDRGGCNPLPPRGARQDNA
jgi:hypothetical protein